MEDIINQIKKIVTLKKVQLDEQTSECWTIEGYDKLASFIENLLEEQKKKDKEEALQLQIAMFEYGQLWLLGQKDKVPAHIRDLVDKGVLLIKERESQDT